MGQQVPEPQQIGQNSQQQASVTPQHQTLTPQQQVQQHTATPLWERGQTRSAEQVDRTRVGEVTTPDRPLWEQGNPEMHPRGYRV